MTRTTSVKTDLQNGLAVFGFELKKCRTTLIIYAILAGFLTILTYALSWVKYSDFLTPNYAANSAEGALLFCRIAALLIFLLTSVFTIVYTIRLFSYLHNKRKADRVNPLPVKSGVLFIAKALTAYAASIVPALFFLGIICFLSVLMGAVPPAEVLSLFGQIPLGAIACISFYGLLAVCCGTSVNAVLIFLAINACYPLSANLVKGMIDSFFMGLPPVIGNAHFLMKALNPLAAYDGVNVLYWLLFTAGCFALSVFLLRRRRAELAQTGFAFRLPCYVVEVLITFLAGMVIGVLFGSLNMLGNGFAGFAFGFFLGGGTAFVITHAVLFSGFSRILKSLMTCGGAAALVMGFAAICCFAAPAYTDYLPERNEIESAGYVSFTDQMLTFRAFSDEAKIAREAAADHNDSENIDRVYRLHQAVLNHVSNRSLTRKFRSVFSLAGGSKKAFAYKLKNGATVTRVYHFEAYFANLIDNLAPGTDTSAADYFDYYFPGSDEEALTKTPEYREKYSVPGRLTAQDLKDITVSFDYDIIHVTAREDIEELLAAYRSEYITLGGENSYSSVRLYFNYSGRAENSVTAFSLLSLQEDYKYLYGMVDSFYVPGTYTETRKVMKEIGILDENGGVNRQSSYYQSNFHDENPDIYYGNELMGEEGFGYNEGDTVQLDSGFFISPWNCNEMIDGTMSEFYDVSSGELLMFQSWSKTDMKNDYAGKAEATTYANDFQVIQVLTRETALVENGVYGTAKVKANGKEETLRYMQFGEENTMIFFLTGKASDEEMNSILKSYRLY